MRDGIGVSLVGQVDDEFHVDRRSTWTSTFLGVALDSSHV